MKKVLFVLAAALGSSAIAGATTIACVVNQATTPTSTTSASTLVSCNGVSAATVSAAGVGSYISSIVLTVKGTFNDSAIAPSYVGIVNFAFTEQSPDFVIATISGNAPNGGGGADTGSTGNLTGSQNGLSLANLAAFNVSVLESVVSGGRIPTDSRVTVTYDYTLFTPVATPEPATLGFMGLGLGAMAIAALRKKR